MEATFVLTGMTALVGAGSGLLALLTIRRQQQHPLPPPKPEPHVVSVELVDFSVKLEEAFERALEKHQATPPILDLPEPDWMKEMIEDVRLANDRAAVAANRPLPELQAVVAELVRIAAKLDELLELPPAQPVDESLDLQKKLVQRMAEAIEPLTELPGRLNDMMQRWASTGSNVMITTAPPLMLGGGPPVPPRPRATPPRPRATPVAPVTSVSSIPCPYVAGAVTVPAGQPTSLLALCQELQPNCPSTSAELMLTSEGSIFVGSASALGGVLNSSNYGYELVPGTPRIYRSSYPGSQTPLAFLQVFAAAETVLHIEVTT